MQYTDVLKIVLETSGAEQLLPTTLNSAEVAGGSRWCVGEGRSASVLPFQINHQLLFEIKPIIAELPYLHMTESVPVWKQWHYEYNVLCCGKNMRLGKPRRFFQQLVFTHLWLNFIAYPLPFHKLGLDLLQDYNLCLKTRMHLKSYPQKHVPLISSINQLG